MQDNTTATDQTTTERALEVAKIIASQIPQMDKWAIGYRQPLAIRDQAGGLRFKVNSRAQLVEVILDWNDTYTIRYSKFRGTTTTLIEERSGVYCDQLGETLYQMTQGGASQSVQDAADWFAKAVQS